MRSDLPSGVKLAHVAHAANESLVELCPNGTIVVILAVPSEGILRGFAELFELAGIAHKVIVEDAGPHTGEATAIGVVPVHDRSRVKKVTGHLALAA